MHGVNGVWFFRSRSWFKVYPFTVASTVIPNVAQLWQIASLSDA